MIKVDNNFFDCISAKEQAYIEVLAKAALIFSNYRYDNQLSQKQLSEKLRVAQAMVSKLESGETNISLKKLSDYLFDLGLKLGITAIPITTKKEYLLEEQVTLRKTIVDTFPNSDGIINYPNFELVA